MGNFLSERKKVTEQELELIFSAEPIPQAEKPKFVLWLSNIWQQFAKTLIQSEQPMIRLSKNKAGEIRWSVYDPITGWDVILYSEEEVRIWLEQRYYSKALGVASHRRI